MTALNLEDSPEPQPAVQVKGGLTGKHLAIAGGGGVGLALVVIDLLKGDPKAWTTLLEHWGPGFLLGLVFLYYLHDFLTKVGSGVVKEAAAANRNLANVGTGMLALSRAVDRISNKSDRFAEESRTLAQFAARTSERVHCDVRDMSLKVDMIFESVLGKPAPKSKATLEGGQDVGSKT